MNRQSELRSPRRAIMRTRLVTNQRVRLALVEKDPIGLGMDCYYSRRFDRNQLTKSTLCPYDSVLAAVYTAQMCANTWLLCAYS